MLNEYFPFLTSTTKDLFAFDDSLNSAKSLKIFPNDIHRAISAFAWLKEQEKKALTKYILSLQTITFAADPAAKYVGHLLCCSLFLHCFGLDWSVGYESIAGYKKGN